MRNIIVHSVVPLDLTGGLYIAGEDHFFTLGIFVGRPERVIVVLGQRFTILMR